jgi:ribosomal protein S21
MREDEEFGKQAFDQYLAAKGVTERIWRDGGDKREPPDYYLTAENEDFVVEVTTLDQQILTPRGIVVSRDGIDKAIKDFVKAIERDALAQGILQGEFFVWFGPLEIDLHPKRKELKSLILEQIRAMQFSKEITEKGSWETSDIEIEGEQYRCRFISK